MMHDSYRPGRPLRKGPGPGPGPMQVSERNSAEEKIIHKDRLL